jgi:hypothetical protein
MNLPNIIRRDYQELQKVFNDLYSMDAAIAHFIKTYEDELSDYDLDNIGLIHKQIKAMAPHLK